MTAINKIQKIAISRAISMIISNLEAKDCLTTYNKIVDGVDKYEDNSFELDRVLEGIVVWFPFQSNAWGEILEAIHDLADRFEDDINQALELARQGLIESAIDGSLDGDMTQVDMETMVTVGDELETGVRVSELD